MITYTSLDNPEIERLLKSGGVGVLPADTVYGLMGSAMNSDAAARLYKLKHREKKPGTVIAASVDQLVELGLKRRYLAPVVQYWPGAVSVIIPCGPELSHLHLGMQSLAVRIPNDTGLLDLLKQTGPLLTSSANITGQPTATTLEQAQAYFGESVDFYVNGGDLSDRLPSTIVRVIDDEIEVLRHGAVDIN